MFSEKSDSYVETAISLEYEAAVQQHGQAFNNDDEAMDVLIEEIKEALKEAGRMYIAAKGMETDGLNQADLDNLDLAARNAIKESAQVLAVIRKYRNQGTGLTYEDVERMR